MLNKTTCIKYYNFKGVMNVKGCFEMAVMTNMK